MRKKAFVLLCFFPLLLKSQDTITAHYERKSVSIFAARVVPVQPGVKYEKPDSVLQERYAAGTITDLLGQNGILLLKTYGGGSLSTTAVRGASASQTPVMWNGFNLQSPTNGNVDLSLLPVILFDNISIQNGAGSAVWGTGAIGGVISTGNRTDFRNNLNIRYAGTIGSFGENNNGIKLGWSNDSFAAGIRAYRQQAQNNFTFYNKALAGSPLDTLTNSAFFQQGALAEFGLQKGLHLFNLRVWYQESDRAIPPTMLEAGSNARQIDHFLRSMFSYEGYYRGITLKARTGLLTEYLWYDTGHAPMIPISETNVLSSVSQLELRRNFQKHTAVLSGFSETWSQASVSDVFSSIIQNRAGAFVSFYYYPEKWNIALTLREEMTGDQFSPLVGSMGIERAIWKYFSVMTSFGRNYRVPTLNDLYWVPGGNPDLKPEDSWNAEASLIYRQKIKTFDFSYTVTGFYRHTRNWILWRPSGPGYWSPQNLLEVKSQGAEHRLRVEWKKNKWALLLLGGYDYVLATNEKSLIASDASLKKQLVYLPAHRTHAMLQAGYRKFYVSFTHQYAGLRFTASDHSEWLPPFAVMQLTAGKRFDFRDSFADIFFRINNLFDKEFQSITWRAMPGRSFQVGFTIDFNRKNKPQ
ncbi:MAG TPA: TonB-dependent receptor [Bacteroidia bacterium]|nr:TonB-dependent receptor [Bacteroidia bacterium]